MINTNRFIGAPMHLSAPIESMLYSILHGFGKAFCFKSSDADLMFLYFMLPNISAIN